MYENGIPLQEISDITGITYNTIKRYLDEDYSPKFAKYGDVFPGKLSPFRQEVIQLRKQKKSFQEVFKMGQSSIFMMRMNSR